MIFVREIKESTWNSLDLKRVESSYSFGNRQAVIEIIVNYQMWCCPVNNVCCWVPTFKIWPIVPKGTIEL